MNALWAVLPNGVVGSSHVMVLLVSTEQKNENPIRSKWDKSIYQGVQVQKLGQQSFLNVSACVVLYLRYFVDTKQYSSIPFKVRLLRGIRKCSRGNT